MSSLAVASSPLEGKADTGGVGGLGEDGGVIVDVVDVDDELRGAGAGRRA